VLKVEERTPRAEANVREGSSVLKRSFMTIFGFYLRP